MGGYTTEAMNHANFICSAYGIVAGLLLGYGIFLFWHRHKLKEVLRVLNSEE